MHIQACLCSEKEKGDVLIRKESGWEVADERGKQFTIVSSLDLIIVLSALLLSSVLFFEGPTDKNYSSILKKKKPHKCIIPKGKDWDGKWKEYMLNSATSYVSEVGSYY